LEVGPVSPTVRERNRFYGPSFRSFTGRLYALGMIERAILRAAFMQLLSYFDEMFIIFRFALTEVTDKFSFEL
jgi:hypothetical protein